MPEMTEDRELRRTTRGTGAAAAPRNTQNGGSAISSVGTRAKDAIKTASAASPPNYVSGVIPIKRSASDQGSAKDNDEMDVDSMVQPEIAAEDSGELARESRRDELSQDER